MKEFRKEYQKESMSRESLLSDPMQQFKKWFDQAVQEELKEPNIFVLATADASLQVRSRVVLLKEMTDSTFVIYSNYESQKGKDIKENPKVSLLFFWEELERQVRIEAIAQKYDEQKSKDYFSQRPRGSQLGAWTSPQSQVIENRAFLENRYAEIQSKFSEQEKITKPEFWGGYEFVPNKFEFWQGRSNRLHDRLVYTKSEGDWVISRIAP